MSYIDEAAKEINLKVVWYSATPGTAAALVRYVGERTRPDLKRIEPLQIGSGATITHLQFVPAALGTIRGFQTRFHLYAIEVEGSGIEDDADRLLLFRGVDGCVFIGGEGEAAALARLDGILAALSYANVASVYGTEATVPAATTGSVLGFPTDDCVNVSREGAGVFDALKAVARKLLTQLAGRELPTRPTPPPGTPPLVVTPRETIAPTFEEMQRGLDEYQRGYHEKAIWLTGLELDRFTPDDTPATLPHHTIHVLRPSTSDGTTVMTNGFARGAPHLELRADTSRYGWQIGMTLAFLGRLAFVQHRDGGLPWHPYDIVTTREAPVFGMAHFVLVPGGSVNASGTKVTIYRVIPITVAEHATIEVPAENERMIAWLDARASGMLDRWLPALEHERAFLDG
jgi:hypothetical protein